MNRKKRWFIIFIVVILILGVVLFRSHLIRPSTSPTPTPQAGLPLTGSQGFEKADGPRSFSFPADFGPNPNFQTEWWYYTGNLETDSGRHFGFELAIFRRGLLPPSQQAQRPSDWAANEIYMGHFALTDATGNQFHAFQRFERGSADLAGAQGLPNYRVYIDDWSVSGIGTNHYELEASDAGISLKLGLTDTKGPVLEGDQGYSLKSSDPGNASYYYSQTRLATSGTVSIDGQSFSVKGGSWMDHEFSTSALSSNEVGWDWFAFQLDDGTDLMLYQMRSAFGAAVGSTGAWFSKEGVKQSLASADFSIKAASTWKSPHSLAIYPSSWVIDIPSKGLHLEITPYIPDQELNLAFTYWEGAVKITGSQSGQAISGQGYIELTGYAAPMNGQF